MARERHLEESMQRKTPLNPEKFKAECEELGVLEALARICKESHVSLEDAYGERRDKLANQARAACFLWLRDRGFSHPQIGKLWGRDHTSSISAIQTHRLRLREKVTPYEVLEHRVARLEEKLAKMAKILGT
jgi:chromosomal replication initiation ATPase DnaA